MTHYKVLFLENTKKVIGYAGAWPPAHIDIKMCKHYYAVDVCGDRVHLLVRYGWDEIKDPRSVAGRAWELLSPDSDRNCRRDYVTTEIRPDEQPRQLSLFRP
jgi:uncharacterized CHY-type Zn-finger protein